MNSTHFNVAVASFEFEGNDFSPKICGPREFALFLEKAEVIPGIAASPLALTGGIETLQESASVSVIPILATQGGSGGTVDRSFFEHVVDKIIQGLKDIGPVEGIYLALHGAMTSPGYPDAEGELLRRVREAVGDKPIIAVSLDLHANVTAQMIEHASILVGYENYPHDDAYTTGKKACRLLLRALVGELRPVMSMVRLKMLIPVVGGSTLVPGAPLQQVKALARKLERDGVESISYFTCQPWLDDDRASNVVVAIADQKMDLAKAAAETVARDFWARREAFVLPLLPIDDAISRALAAEVKPCVLADTGDSVGAGAAGDASFVLAHLMAQAGEAKCALSLVDAEVASLATAAGVGATVSVAVGFKLDGRHGAPLCITAKVVTVHSGEFTYLAGPSAGTTGYMGPCAVLQVRNIFVLVTTHGTYEYADEQFRAVGIDSAGMDIVVLKNGMNFRNLLAEGASWFLIDSVGSSSSNLAALPWKNKVTPFWPRDTDISEPFTC
jgi:microcystin degradation protein MlrC